MLLARLDKGALTGFVQALAAQPGPCCREIFSGKIQGPAANAAARLLCSIRSSAPAPAKTKHGGELHGIMAALALALARRLSRLLLFFCSRAACAGRLHARTACRLLRAKVPDGQSAPVLARRDAPPPTLVSQAQPQSAHPAHSAILDLARATQPTASQKHLFRH